MRFQPKTEEQITSENLIPAKTECDFEVIKADDKTSKKGNEMVEVKLRVWHEERDFLITDYIMEAMMAKLLHFCETTGLTQQYANGHVKAADCLGRTGKLVIGVDDKDPAYLPKNVVKDYIGHRKSAPPKVGNSPALEQALHGHIPKPAIVKTAPAKLNNGEDDDIFA